MPKLTSRLKMRFPGFNESTNGVGVIALEVDYAGSAPYLDAAIEEACKAELEPWECGVDIMGRTHSDDNLCPNTTVDDLSEQYCRVQRARSLALQRDCDR